MTVLAKPEWTEPRPEAELLRERAEFWEREARRALRRQRHAEEMRAWAEEDATGQREESPLATFLGGVVFGLLLALLVGSAIWA